MTVHCTKTPDAYNLSESDPSRITCRTHQSDCARTGILSHQAIACAGFGHPPALPVSNSSSSLLQHCFASVRPCLSIASMLCSSYAGFGRQPPLPGSSSLSSLLQYRFVSVPSFHCVLIVHCFHGLLLVLIVHCFHGLLLVLRVHCFPCRPLLPRPCHFHPMHCRLIPCFNIQITILNHQPTAEGRRVKRCIVSG